MNDSKAPAPNSSVALKPYVLYLAMLSVGMGQTVIYAVMPALGRELGLDTIQLWLPFLDQSWQPGKLAITSLSAMTALVFALVAPYWGRKSDMLGRKSVILIGLFGYTLGTLLFNVVAYAGFQGLITGGMLWLLLVLARVVHAAIMSATFPASNAYIIDVTPLADRAKGLGRMSAANQLGVLMGPVMAAAVVAGFLMPLIIQASITFICALLVYYFLPESRELNLQSADGVSKNNRLKDKKTSIKLSFFDPRYQFILPIGLVLYTMQGMVQQTLGFYCEDVLGMSRMSSVQFYATAMMFSSLAMIAAQLFIVQRSSLSCSTLIRCGLPFCALGYAVIAFTATQLGLLLGMAMFGFGVGLVMPGFSAAASYTVDSREQGNLSGLIGSIAGMGFVIGPLMGGAMYNVYLSGPCLLAAIILSFLAVYVLMDKRFSDLGADA
jgi:MFS transporter, DHA1 family, multidrug resistance protein